MKTVNLKNIRKVNGKFCTIMYNGAGSYEVEVDDLDFRQNLNYIVNKVCETEKVKFIIRPGTILHFRDGSAGQVVSYGSNSYGIKYYDGTEDDFEQLPESFKII